MEVRIGIVNSPAIVTVDMADDVSVDDIKAQIEAAIVDGGAMVWLADRKGRETGFPAARLAFIECGGDEARIGFS